MERRQVNQRGGAVDRPEIVEERHALVHAEAALVDADAPALVAALDDDARLGLGAREVELVELASQPDDLLDRVRAVLELVARAADGGGVGLELDEGDRQRGGGQARAAGPRDAGPRDTDGKRTDCGRRGADCAAEQSSQLC